MSILNLMASSNYITLSKELIKKIGLKEAVLFGELASEHSYWETQGKLENGYFFSTSNNIEEHTTLSEYEQRKALNKLKELNLIDVEIKGLPARRFIKINEEQVLELFNINNQKKSGTSSEKIKELDTKKLKGNNNIYNNNKEIIIKNNKYIGEEGKNENPKPNIENLYMDNSCEMDFTPQRRVEGKPTINYKEFMDIYNSICYNLPQVKILTDKRKKQIKLLKTKLDINQFREVCKLANTNSFLMGNNDRGWKADFDFITRLDKAVTILEGGYQSNKPKTEGQQLIDMIKGGCFDE